MATFLVVYVDLSSEKKTQVNLSQLFPGRILLPPVNGVHAPALSRADLFHKSRMSCVRNILQIHRSHSMYPTLHESINSYYRILDITALLHPASSFLPFCVLPFPVHFCPSPLFLSFLQPSSGFGIFASNDNDKRSKRIE